MIILLTSILISLSAVAVSVMPDRNHYIYIVEARQTLLASSVLEVNEVPWDNRSISEKIIEYAKEYGADESLALNVACAESCARNKEGIIFFNPKAKNPNSTASGIFQFIKGTWESMCEGDVFNENDNIRCGVKLLAAKSGIRHWEVSKKDGFGGGWENRPYKKFNVIN